MNGCNGAMGQVITGLMEEDPDITIVAGIDVASNTNRPYPVYQSIEECVQKADVVIDFSTAGAVDSLLRYCGKTGLPIVECTTGLSPEQIKLVEETAKTIAVLRSANMSLGVNVLLKLVQEAARVLAAADFDIEILEKHHNQKVDAPSGTALALADSINEVMDNLFHYKYDRASERVKRDKSEIGIQAIRGGTIVGEHDVIFAGKDEVITLSHTAYSKAIFAKGAVSAAKFLANKQPGLYTMTDVVG